MEPAAAVELLDREAAAFADLLVPDALAAPVPTCPGWTVLDLALHLGGVHRWARDAVLGVRSSPPSGPQDPTAVRAWCRDGAAALVATLAATPPDAPCWTFAPPGSAGWWMRRQAHETALHRWDAATALGAPPAPGDGVLDDDVALDGIAEVLEVLLPRQLRLGRLAPQPGALELVPSTGPPSVLRTDTGDAPPAAAVHGTPTDLLLLLWGRIDVDDPRVAVVGPLAEARRLAAGALTP